MGFIERAQRSLKALRTGIRAVSKGTEAGKWEVRNGGYSLHLSEVKRSPSYLCLSCAFTAIFYTCILISILAGFLFSHLISTVHDLLA